MAETRDSPLEMTLHSQDLMAWDVHRGIDVENEASLAKRIRAAFEHERRGHVVVPPPWVEREGEPRRPRGEAPHERHEDERARVAGEGVQRHDLQHVL